MPSTHDYSMALWLGNLLCRRVVIVLSTLLLPSRITARNNDPTQNRKAAEMIPPQPGIRAL